MIRFDLTSPLVTWAACWIVAGPACSMTLLVGSTDLEPGHVAAVADAGGRLVPSGTGFIAVGAFGDLDDGDILAAAGRGDAMQEVLGRFQQLGDSQRFGLGQGLEHIDGAFQASVSAATRAGDGLVGRPVYVVGGTDHGIFIYKSTLTFEADNPVATGAVNLWGDEVGRAGGLLVGSVGESLEVLELGSSGHSLRLAPVDGPGLDLSRFEATMEEPEGPPTGNTLPGPVAEVVPPVSVPAVPLVPPVPEPAAGAVELPTDLKPIEWWADPVWPTLPGIRVADGSAVLEIGLFLDGGVVIPWDGWVYQTMTTSFTADVNAFAAGGVGPVFVPEPGCLVLVAGGGLLMFRRSRSTTARRAT